MLVWILSDHDEYGAENVCATIDKFKLAGLIDTNWPDKPNETLQQRQHAAEWRNRARMKLLELLTHPEEELLLDHKHELHEGWGGMQLHVVELR